MNKLPCEVVMDLIPLVKDHVASKKSEDLVKAHIRECENCRQYYELLDEPSFDDQKIIETIHHKRNLYLSLFLLAGIVMGYLLSSSYFMFFNVLIMPFIGILCHFIKPEKTYRLAFLCAILFTTLSVLGTLLEYGFIEGIFMNTFIIFILMFILIMIGKLLAMLLNYAWKGRWK